MHYSMLIRPSSVSHIKGVLGMHIAMQTVHQHPHELLSLCRQVLDEQRPVRGGGGAGANSRVGVVATVPAVAAERDSGGNNM